MPDDQQFQTEQFYLDILGDLSTRLNEVSQPHLRLQVFLEDFLQALHTQWPEIARAEVYIQQPDGTYQRRAVFGAAADEPAAIPPDSPAARALATGKLAAPDASPGHGGWGIPLARGLDILGILQIELPAEAGVSSGLSAVLPTLGPVLGLAVDHLRTTAVENKELLDRTSSALNRVLQSTRQRVTYEKTLSTVTSHLQEQTELLALLQLVMQDVGKVLGARRARVRLQVTGPESASIVKPKLN